MEERNREGPEKNKDPDKLSPQDWLMIKDYLGGYAAQLRAVEADPDNSEQHYFLSWFALFVEIYDLAIEAAEKTLALNPETKSVARSLAAAYLMQGQWADAEAIYKEWRGKRFPDEAKWMADELFLLDLADLEAAGIVHPDFARVRGMFLK